mmetsp:Transcript_52444/g.166801  ORF Transcript_52444/g.166801 Transcript_52444/m.166801 type:complete len:327 (+) Transcript_52444:194-1174(+)
MAEGSDGQPFARDSLRVLAVATVLTLATSSQGLLTTASKTNGVYLYNFATVPLLSELCKFLVSLHLLMSDRRKDASKVNVTTDPRTVATYLIPSIIYLVHNNVQFMTLKYVDPSTYQILGNLKIVTTGVMFRVFLKRRLSKLQWIALMLLMVGATTSQVSGCGGGTFSAPIEGYMLGLLSAFLSALAAVYTEYIMKRNDDSLYWQNMQLYGFGVLFNALRLTFDDINNGFNKGAWPFTMFDGYDAITVLVVCNLAFTGLLVSWVMKYADSIVKVYSTSMAMLVTMVVSIFLFGISPNMQLGRGTALSKPITTACTGCAFCTLFGHV